MANLIETNHFCIYFGDANDNLRINNIYPDEKILLLQKKIMQSMNKKIDRLFFLKQTHSTDVIFLDANNQSKSAPICFVTEGDALITKEKNVGIGVVTADCLPVVFYDAKHHAIGVAHAGWRGLSTKIISHTIEKMKTAFNTKSADLAVYLGPSAGVCCYEVQTDFLQHLPKTVFEKKIIESHDEKIYFNARQSAYIELLDNQVKATSIDFSNNHCTICEPGFCSARTQKENAGRQPTVCVL
jgi:YfiH family protein